jgi:DNA polymerase I-like protein with 3'-5' exonuclease and polymerase domains/RecA-family ATPase
MYWKPPTELPDLRRAGVIALDLETRDDRLAAGKGSGWATGEGYIVGVSVAYRANGEIRAHYFPLRHPEDNAFDGARVFEWLKALIASDVHIVTQNGLYDWGWLCTETTIRMPPPERLEEIGALATLVDENRYSYRLGDLCAWRSIPGKNEAGLLEGAAAIGLPKKAKPAANIWKMPARFVGAYAEQDAASTLALFESLNPVIDEEGTRAAYRLEVELLPMVLEMRRRGVRIDTARAEQARDRMLQKRDAIFAELSEKLGAPVTMAEIGRSKRLAATFDVHKIKYPRTAKGNPSFTAGSTGWMHKHPHWLPPLIVKADRYNKAGLDFLQGHILDHVVKGRVHAEIHPHRSDDGGTRSLRFSYSNPPLQQMAARDEEIAPLIRGCFLPEPDEVWAKPDISQQEFRFIVHYAAQQNLNRAQEAAELYRADPNTDFHDLVASWTGIDRRQAKNTNFAKAFGAGIRKFAAMIGLGENEARAIYDKYDRTLPFVRQLSKRCSYAAASKGYLELYDGARRHWNDWVAWANWRDIGPCSREEAERRIADQEHPWYRKGPPHRIDTHKAMNALIQGSAARHTKLWMREVWREGITPILQMHDCLDLSVASPEQAERVAQMAREVVKLEVPVEVDLKFGRNWGDATHSWAELQNGVKIADTVLAGHQGSGEPEITHPEPFILVEPEDEDCTPVENPPRAENPGGAAEHEHRNGFDDDHAHAGTGKTKNRDGYPHGSANTGHQVAFFVYRHADGSNYLGVKKTSTKQFVQHHWTGSTWAFGAPAGPKIPYRLPELIKAPRDAWVVIAAGEKDADTAAALGFVATTNPEGERKGAWAAELNAWFAGHKRVAVMEDNDDTGRAHVIEVAEALRGIVPDIRIVTFRDLIEHGDLSDWAPGHNHNDLLTKIEAAKAYHPRPQPSPIRQWENEPVPELEYSVPNRFPLDNVALFSGEGGQGKSSLVQQLCVAHGLALEWLGCIPRQGHAIYIECEDAERVLHWRLKAIAMHYSVSLTSIADAGFEMYSLVEEENAILATTPDKTGIIRPTALYDWLYELAGDLKPVMIGIASSANVFAGSENSRTDVQQFIRLLRRIAHVAHGTVLLVTQPSLSGIENKSSSHEGLSGTTQWHNAVRARAVMKSVKSEDGTDSGLRTVAFHKNQYGPASATAYVRYQNGLFLPVEGMAVDAAERATQADMVFVALLKKFTAQKQVVSHLIGRNYAPTRFAEHHDANGITKKEFTKAMQRLLDAKIIEIKTWGRPSRQTHYLAVAERNGP